MLHIKHQEIAGCSINNQNLLTEKDSSSGTVNISIIK